MTALNFHPFRLACGEATTLRMTAHTMSDRLCKSNALLVQDPRDEGKNRSLQKHLSTAERHPQHVALQVGVVRDVSVDKKWSNEDGNPPPG